MMNKFLSESPWQQDNGIALIRVITGAFLIYHGMEVFDAAKMNEYLGWDMFKESSSAKFMVYAGKGSEFVGGVLLFLGLFTRIGCIIIAITLAYIAFIVGKGRIWYQDQYPFLFVLLSLVFIFTGPGSFSLDRLFFKNR